MQLLFINIFIIYTLFIYKHVYIYYVVWVASLFGLVKKKVIKNGASHFFEKNKIIVTLSPRQRTKYYDNIRYRIVQWENHLSTSDCQYLVEDDDNNNTNTPCRKMLGKSHII